MYPKGVGEGSGASDVRDRREAEAASSRRQREAAPKEVSQMAKPTGGRCRRVSLMGGGGNWREDGNGERRWSRRTEGGASGVD